MTNTASISINHVESTDINDLSYRFYEEKLHEKGMKSVVKAANFNERVKYYFITHDGRMTCANFCFTLISVVIQHCMGTCNHSISDGTTIIYWHVFTPPFGAGPHTAVFYFVLSWIALAYSVEHIWNYLITGIHASKTHDLIVHGIILILYLFAFAFNIWGYVLCESASRVNRLATFTPGICRGDSQTCIPLIAGILTSFAAACSYSTENLYALMKLLRNYRILKESSSIQV